MANAIHYIDNTLAASEGIYTNGAAYTPPGVDKNGVAYVLGNIYANMTLSTAARAGVNNKVYFKRGQYHTPDNAFITTAQQAFSDYGPMSLNAPVIDCNAYFPPTAAEDALWTHSGGGVWTQTLAGATGYASCSLWTGSDQGTYYSRTQGLFRRRAASAATVGPNAIWFVNTGAPYAITVYTGSTTVAPPSSYGGITINQQGATRCINRAFVYRNGANDGRVSYLKIIGSSSSPLGASSLTTANVTGMQAWNFELNSCNDGIFMSGNTAGTFSPSAFKFWNFVIDANVTSAGIDLSPSDWMNADWINCWGGAINGTFDNFKITTANCHTGINTDNLGAGPYFRPSHITFSNGSVFFIDGSTDGRGIGCNAANDLTFDNIWTFRAPAHGQTSGQRIRHVSCGWVDMQLNTTNISESAQLHAAMSRSGAAVITTNADILYDHCLFDTRNSTDQCVGSLGFITHNAPAIAIPLNSITVTNCLALLGVGRGFLVYSPLTGAAVAINNQIITKNWASLATGTAINKVGQVNYPPASWVDEGLNVTLAATGNTSAVQSALLLNTDYSLQAGSPLIAAGAHNVYKNDASGRQFWNIPAVGAFEYVRGRSGRG